MLLGLFAFSFVGCLWMLSVLFSFPFAGLDCCLPVLPAGGRINKSIVIKRSLARQG